MSELRQSLRRLRSAWSFTLFAVLTLAVGIGATTAIYSVAYATVFRPSDIKDVDQVINLYHSNSTGALHELALSWPDVMDIRARQTVFSDMMEWSYFVEAVSGPSEFTIVRGELVSGNYFQFVGAQPLVGRTLQPGDDDRGKSDVAVISHAYWRRQYGADPSVIGRSLTLKGRPVVIVGVMPPSFRGVDLPNIMPTNLWVPIGMAPLLGAGVQSHEVWSNRERRWVFAKGRLLTGKTLDAARAQLTTISDILNRIAPIGQGSTASRPARRAIVSFVCFQLPTSTHMKVSTSLPCP